MLIATFYDNDNIRGLSTLVLIIRSVRTVRGKDIHKLYSADIFVCSHTC